MQTLILPKTKAQRKAEYAEYLKSGHWKELREERLRRAKHQCEMCRCKKRLHVHHCTYRHPWTSCTVDDLKVLCRWCHAGVHGRMIPREPKEARKPKHKTKAPDKKFIKQRALYRKVEKQIALNARPGNTHYIVFPDVRPG